MFSPKRLGRFLLNLLGVTVGFLLCALIFAVLTEGITHRGELPGVLRTGRFWLAVGVDTIPVLLAMALTLWLPARFVQTVYGLDSWRDGINFILNSRLDMRGFGPWAKVEKGRISPGGDNILSNLGGPGHLVVYNDSAVVLERAGRLTRVEGVWESAKPPRPGCSEKESPGFPRLDPFERIYGVVDLRPKRSVQTVSALSREGIPLQWDVEIQYQIDGGAPSTQRLPYPISVENVLRAATSSWVSHEEGTRVLNWESRLEVEADRLLRSILAERQMDHLIGQPGSGNRTAREEVQAQLESELRSEAPKLGAQILKVRLDNLRVDDGVGQQWIEAWKARWQRWSMDWLAHAEASRIYEYETAKAEAQMQMIVQLTQTLQGQIASRAVPAQAVPQIILMRLFSVLDRADFAPSSRVFFPTETVRALEGIQRTLAAGSQEVAASLRLAAKSAIVVVEGSVDLEANVRDARDEPVPDGTPVYFMTTMGRVSPSMVPTTAGVAQTTLAPGSLPGPATVTAWSGPVSDSVTITIE